MLNGCLVKISRRFAITHWLTFWGEGRPLRRLSEKAGLEILNLQNPAGYWESGYCILSKPEPEGVTRNFKEVERRFGSGFHDKYERIVEKLETSFNTNDKGGV